MRTMSEIKKNGRVRVLDSDHSGVAFQTGSLRVIASNGGGWDHVSVSMEHRIPTWSEMEFVREICFFEDETAMQLSVPRDQHKNIHPNCLHLWRPQEATIPLPPPEYV